MNARKFGVMLVVVTILVATLVVPTISAQQLESREERLVRLDGVFRTKGVEDWLKAAGLSWTSIEYDARNIEEETIIYSGDTRVLASGIQVTAKSLRVIWPCVVTTGDPSVIMMSASSRRYQPDLRNPSVLYTDVEANGPVTVWVDCSNWSQLWPAGYSPVQAAAPTSVPTTAVLLPSVTPTPPIAIVTAAQTVTIQADPLLCENQIGLVVATTAQVQSMDCGTGVWVIDIQEVQTRFGSFGDAEAFRAGRTGTFWFEPAQAITATAAQTVTIQADPLLCENQIGLVVATTAQVQSMDCGTGVWVIDIQEVQTRFGSFGDAEAFRAGRTGTFWFEPKWMQTGVVVAPAPVVPTAATVAPTAINNTLVITVPQIIEVKEYLVTEKAFTVTEFITVPLIVEVPREIEKVRVITVTEYMQTKEVVQVPGVSLTIDNPSEVAKMLGITFFVILILVGAVSLLISYLVRRRRAQPHN